MLLIDKNPKDYVLGIEQTSIKLPTLTNDFDGDIIILKNKLALDNEMTLKDKRNPQLTSKKYFKQFKQGKVFYEIDLTIMKINKVYIRELINNGLVVINYEKQPSIIYLIAVYHPAIILTKNLNKAKRILELYKLGRYECGIPKVDFVKDMASKGYYKNSK